jgi:hypothetical protein
MVHYVIVEPANGKLELPDVPRVYEVGELVPTARPELAGVAPVLYCAEHPDVQLPALRGRAERDLAAGVPPVLCAIVESDKATGRLQRHLADQLILSKPASGDAVFRYYDPRVFLHLRRILKPEQLGALLGPVAVWTCLDGITGWATVKGAQAPEAGLRVTQAQYERIGRIELVQRALGALRSNGVTMKPDIPELLDVQLAKGDGYGLVGADLLAFAMHGVLISPYFDRHPRVRAVLHASEKAPYAEAMSAWTGQDWEAVARESIQYQ